MSLHLLNLESSDSFDIASSYLTRNLNEGIKGPTINAIASSLPELLISFFFLFYIGDLEGFSAGYATIIGSSIFNIAIIPAVSFLIIYYKKGISYFLLTKNNRTRWLFLNRHRNCLVSRAILWRYIHLPCYNSHCSLLYLYFLVFKKRNNKSLTNTDSTSHNNKEDYVEEAGFFKKIITLTLQD